MSARSNSREAGLALVIGLVVLSTLGLTALAAARSALFEERMSGNVDAETRAFHAAESALRSASAELVASPGDAGEISWVAAGLAPWDCAGAGLVSGDPAAWPQLAALPAPDTVYVTRRVVRLAAPGRPSMPCLPEAMADSELYLVAAYAEGSAGRGSVMLIRSFVRSTENETILVKRGHWQRRGIQP